ncbi:MAG: potassium uptake system protein [Chloroflexi bacterium]|nr:MAG: potassium uptake system protein [Chloroflexota bacterium]
MRTKQFLVIGAGRFGTALATTLYQFGHEVVVVDSDEQVVEDIMTHVTHAIIADATDEDALRKMGVSNFDAVIVAIGEDLESNILATVAASSAGARQVISKAKNEVAARVLSRVGANLVIRPEHDMGVRLARQLSAPDVIDTLKLGENHGVIEVEVHKNLTGTLGELRLPNRFGVQVITVNRNNQIFVSPAADFRLQPGDKVLLIGENRGIEKLRDYLCE